MNNMDLYDALRICPAEAKKPIMAGRLRGKTDINPMWRIKMLTQTFGACGIGWYVTVDKQWLEKTDKETAAFCNISLYVKVGGDWSKPIFGTGGSMFAAVEKNGLYTDDDAFKKAYTDAISVACKALGMAADVYWDNDTSSKYSSGNVNTPPSINIVKCPKCGRDIPPMRGKDGSIKQPADILKACGGMCTECYKAAHP